jgi:uncharacterized membrane protein YcaP (DUF421 family)
MDVKMWADMFGLGLPVLEKVIRAALVYTFLLVGLRVGGKRQLAQLDPFDLVVLLILSNTVQNAIIGEDNSVTGGLLGAVTLLALNSLVARVVFSSRRAERIVEGEPVVLMDGGRFQKDALRAELITKAEIEAAAHRHDLDSLEEVDRAVVHPDGTIHFTRRQPTVEDTRHAELLRRLDALHHEVAALRGARA